MPDCVEQILTGGGGAVMSPLMTSADDYTLHLRAAMHEIEAQDISAFHAFTDDEVERCLGHSNVIECAAGDRVLKKGGVARNIFVVLDGTLEARDGEQVVGVIRTGEVFGEMAFLLERPRTHDVYAASDSVRVLSLSESTIRKMVSEDPAPPRRLPELNPCQDGGPPPRVSLASPVGVGPSHHEPIDSPLTFNGASPPPSPAVAGNSDGWFRDRCTDGRSDRIVLLQLAARNGGPPRARDAHGRRHRRAADRAGHPRRCRDRSARVPHHG